MNGTYIRGKERSPIVRTGDVFRVRKEWGEEQWIVNKEYCGKKLLLRKNRRCSMHTHATKDEVFYLQSGKVRMELGKETFVLEPGDFVHVRSNVPHRFTGLQDSEIIEFSTTHDEDDSVRSEFSGHVEQERYDRQATLIRKFTKSSVLVVGDAMLDTYLTGSVERISPEAPIPVVSYRGTRSVPGGAANAASNVASLGGRATLLALCGGDAAGKTLKTLLRKHGVTDAVITDRMRRTTEKQRVVSQSGQQILRLDFEDEHVLSPSLERMFLAKVRTLLRTHDALLLSDYGKGVCTPAVIRACVALARKAKVPVILDPKPRDGHYLKAAIGVTAMTPNHREAAMMAMLPRAASVESIAKKLSNLTRSAVILTMGAKGMILCSDKQLTRFLAHAKEVADVSGAGDTVAATVALTLGAGASLPDAVDISNRAASVVVGKSGTATVTANELLRVL